MKFTLRYYRELNELLAERIMGWPRIEVTVGIHKFPIWSVSEHLSFGNPNLPAFHGRITEAFLVARKVIDDGKAGAVSALLGETIPTEISAILSLLERVTPLRFCLTVLQAEGIDVEVVLNGG